MIKLEDGLKYLIESCDKKFIYCNGITIRNNRDLFDEALCNLDSHEIPEYIGYANVKD